MDNFIFCVNEELCVCVIICFVCEGERGCVYVYFHFKLFLFSIYIVYSPLNFMGYFGLKINIIIYTINNVICADPH